jgi:uncharacterized SAM-binding protein YcdF (DUF218 family)
MVRRTCWSLTIAGKLLIACLVVTAALITTRGLFPFLAVSSRGQGDIMVVEGWIRESSIRQVIREYEATHYRTVVVVNAVYGGGDKWESGRYRGEYLTNAFTRLGVPGDRVSLVACDVVQKDRTYHSALAVKEWLRQQGIPAKSLDVVTVGPHARRSRLLFEKAFGRGVSIGVIALDETGYDPVHWWRSSEGVREVLFEGVAYLYVRFLFSPD